MKQTKVFLENSKKLKFYEQQFFFKFHSATHTNQKVALSYNEVSLKSICAYRLLLTQWTAINNRKSGNSQLPFLHTCPLHEQHLDWLLSDAFTFANVKRAVAHNGRVVTSRVTQQHSSASQKFLFSRQIVCLPRRDADKQTE